jgi:GDP-4-dehydro-6-deoxy-D-mannose reductase
MTAFITGIAGFAGSHLAEHLLARGVRVAGLAHSEHPTRNLAGLAGRVEAHTGDLLDLERLTAILAEVRPERIFHLAALAAPRLSFQDPLAFHRVNALGTATLVLAIERAKLDGTRVLVVSSGEVYGRAAVVPTPEDAPLRPVSPYGASKAAAEQIAIAAFEGRGLAVVRARAFNHTGARQEPDFAAAAFARQIALAEAGQASPEVRVGRLDAVREFGHVEDVVGAYAALLERGRPGEVYNVGTGRGIPVGEALERLVRLARRPVAIVDDPARYRPAEIPRLVAEPRRLAEEVGVRLARPLDDALGALLASWRERVTREGGGGPA